MTIAMHLVRAMTVENQAQTRVLFLILFIIGTKLKKNTLWEKFLKFYQCINFTSTMKIFVFLFNKPHEK